MHSSQEAIELAKSLFKKMPWESQLRPLLKHYDYEVHLGVEKTLNPLIEDFQKDEMKSRTFLLIFKKIYDELLLCGNRTVQIFKLDDDSIDHIKKASKEIFILDSPEKESFPYYLDEETLKSSDEKAQLIHLIEDGDLLTFYFSSNRKITERIRLEPTLNDENEEIFTFLSKFDKVTAYRNLSRQYIDIVNIDLSKKILDIRIDATDISNKKDIDSILESIKNEFKEVSKCCLETFQNKVNFFKSIDELYNDNKTGRVVEISFTTDDGYIHHEKDRGRNASGDVRTSLFHEGGREKTEIDPFKISKRWSDNFNKESISYEFELTLNSKYRDLSSSSITLLDHLIVKMASKKSNYDKIIDLVS